METDFTNVFEWHRKFFQILELSGRPKNWLFKDPSHIEHIPEILKIYPKARFIHIFRDPIKSITSTCSLTEKLWNGLCNQIDRELIGYQTIEFWENAVLHCFLKFKFFFILLNLFIELIFYLSIKIYH